GHVAFVFRAEDGIRDRNVTGVQTCALPISQLSLPSFIALGVWILIGAVFYAVRRRHNRTLTDEQVDRAVLGGPRPAFLVRNGVEIGRASCRGSVPRLGGVGAMWNNQQGRER